MVWRGGTTSGSVLDYLRQRGVLRRIESRLDHFFSPTLFQLLTTQSDSIRLWHIGKTSHQVWRVVVTRNTIRHFWSKTSLFLGSNHNSPQAKNSKTANLGVKKCGIAKSSNWRSSKVQNCAICGVKICQTFKFVGSKSSIVTRSSKWQFCAFKKCDNGQTIKLLGSCVFQFENYGCGAKTVKSARQKLIKF